MRVFWKSSKVGFGPPRLRDETSEFGRGKSDHGECFTVGRASLSSGPAQYLMVYSACCS
jgi:hypothetical protein